MAFIPIHDGNPLTYIRRPYVAWSLILVNVAVFFLLQSGGLEDADRASVVTFGVIPALLNGIEPRPYEFQVFLSACAPFFGIGEKMLHAPQECWVGEIPELATLFTYSFLHGDFWHLAGNMIFLWVFADNIEDSLGHFRFFLFYTLCAIGSGYAYVLTDPGSFAPVVGASGAIAGIVAAYFMLYPFAKVWILVFGRIPLRLNAFLILGFWILFQVYAVIAVGDDSENEVAWWAHIGGLIVGAVLVLVMRRKGVRLFTRPPRPAEILPRPPAIAPEPPRSVDGPWGHR